MAESYTRDICGQIDAHFSCYDTLSVRDLTAGSKSLRGTIIRGLCKEGLLVPEGRRGSGRYKLKRDTTQSLVSMMDQGKLVGLCARGHATSDKSYLANYDVLPVPSCGPLAPKEPTVQDQLVDVVDLFANRVPDAVEKLVDLMLDGMVKQFESMVRMCENQGNEIQNLKTLLEMGRSDLRQKDSRISELQGKLNRLAAARNMVIPEDKILIREANNSKHMGSSR